MKDKKNKEVKNPTHEYFNRKHQTLLTDIGREWFINKMNNPKPPIKITRLTKREKNNRKNPGIIESGV